MSYYHQGHYYRTDEWGTVVKGPPDGAWPTQPGYQIPEPPKPIQIPFNPYATHGHPSQETFTVKRGGQWLINVPYEQLRAFDQVLAETGLATIYPEADFETFSAAGYRWDANLRKWKSLPGLSDQNRGLKAVGTRNYVEHPSFRVLSLGWNLKDGKGERWWRPMTNETLDDLFPTRRGDYTMPWAPGELCDYIANGGILEAWNINFEYVVWNSYCVPIFGWPVLRQEQCRDAMAKARAAAYPGNLADFGRVRKLRNQKLPEGDALVKKLTRPRNPTKGNPELRWTPLTAKEDFAKFYEYNVQDTRAEAEASAKTPDLTERELSVWLFDLRCNMRGMQIDMQSVEHCIAIIEQAELKYNAELRWLTNNAVESYSEVESIVTWCRTQGVYLGKLDAESLEIAIKRTDYPLNVQRVLRIRQQLAFSSVKKYYALRAQTTPYNRLFDQYVYYGAHTSLWNGRDVQPANLYKGIFSKPAQVEHALSLIRTRCLELIEYEYSQEGCPWTQERDERGQLVGNKPVDALEVVASCLRSMIIAKPGHKLISADFTAIQAVATSCMADERWRIEVFRTHGKIYEAMASQLTGNPLQFYLDYKKQNGKHHEHRQSYGKLPVLSGDFGAWINGWKRFGADKILGSDENIKKMILLTRERQPNIVNFWGGQTWNKFRNDECPLLFGLEGAAVSAILEPGTCFSSRPGSHLGVLYEVKDDILYCRPPSGGFIRYHAPRLTPANRDYSRPWEYEMSYEGFNTNQQKGPIGWIRMKLYGGVQCQNTISHMCREIQADALRALEYAKPREYNIVMHTHDEQLAEVPDRIEYNAEEYTAIVRNSLAKWAVCLDGQPWPIKVPLAWEAYRYGKWED
jgi:DNA polymerase